MGRLGQPHPRPPQQPRPRPQAQRPQPARAQRRPQQPWARHTTASLGLALALPLVLAATAQAQGSSEGETGFQPGVRVRAYHQNLFEVSQSYLKELLLDAIPILATAGFVYVLFAILSCMRSSASATTSSGCASPYRQLRSRAYLSVVLCLLGVAAIGILAFLLVQRPSQTQAFDDAIAQKDVMLAWQPETAQQLAAVAGSGDATTIALAAIPPQGQFVSPADLAAALALSGNISLVAGDGFAEATASNLSSLNAEPFSTLVEYDGYLRLVVLLAGCILLGLVVLQLWFTLMNNYGSEENQPSRNCYVLTTVVSIAFLNAILVLWLAVAFLYMDVTLFADFCADPNDAVLRTANLTADPLAVFSIGCGANSSLVSPLDDGLQDLIALQADLDGRLDAMSGALPSNCSDEPACVTANSSLLVAATLVSGISLNGTALDGSPGLAAQLDCEAVNGPYELVLANMCKTYYSSVALTFELALALAVVLTAFEWARRYLPDAVNRVGPTDWRRGSKASSMSPASSRLSFATTRVSTAATSRRSYESSAVSGYTASSRTATPYSARRSVTPSIASDHHRHHRHPSQHQHQHHHHPQHHSDGSVCPLHHAGGHHPHHGHYSNAKRSSYVPAPHGHHTGPPVAPGLARCSCQTYAAAATTVPVALGPEAGYSLSLPGQPQQQQQIQQQPTGHHLIVVSGPPPAPPVHMHAPAPQIPAAAGVLVVPPHNQDPLPAYPGAGAVRVLPPLQQPQPQPQLQLQLQPQPQPQPMAVRPYQPMTGLEEAEGFEAPSGPPRRKTSIVPDLGRASHHQLGRSGPHQARKSTRHWKTSKAFDWKDFDV